MIPTERLRELAASPIADESLLAAELLAARETIAAVGRHRDDLLELNHLDNEAARVAVLSGRENKFRFGAMTTRDAIAEVVAQRDAARAEAKKYHDALVARHGGEPVALLSELDAARAELAKLRGREAEPFDWDALPTVEDWVAEHLPEKEPRAGSQMAEVRADEVIADRGELRRVAGWLKDLLAENARAHAEEMQWPDQVAEALGTTRDRIGATPSMVAGVVAKMRAELAAEQPKPAGGA